MDLIILVLVVCVIGFCVWLVTTKIPMPPGWATAIQVIALILIVLWLLSKIGVVPNVLR